MQKLVFLLLTICTVQVLGAPKKFSSFNNAKIIDNSQDSPTSARGEYHNDNLLEDQIAHGSAKVLRNLFRYNRDVNNNQIDERESRKGNFSYVDQSPGHDVHVSAVISKGTFQYNNVVDDNRNASAIDHFDHKYQAEEDITYGCFGWIDPVGGGHVTFYVSDSKGYRPFTSQKHSVRVYPRNVNDSKIIIVNFASNSTFDKSSSTSGVIQFENPTVLKYPFECIQAFERNVNTKRTTTPKPPTPSKITQGVTPKPPITPSTPKTTKSTTKLPPETPATEGFTNGTPSKTTPSRPSAPETPTTEGVTDMPPLKTTPSQPVPPEAPTTEGVTDMPPLKTTPSQPVPPETPTTERITTTSKISLTPDITTVPKTPSEISTEPPITSKMPPTTPTSPEITSEPPITPKIIATPTPPQITSEPPITSQIITTAKPSVTPEILQLYGAPPNGYKKDTSVSNLNLPSF